MRKTKIVCTIGPASSSEEVFADMCKAGPVSYTHLDVYKRQLYDVIANRDPEQLDGISESQLELARNCVYSTDCRAQATYTVSCLSANEFAGVDLFVVGNDPTIIKEGMLNGLYACWLETYGTDRGSDVTSHFLLLYDPEKLCVVILGGDWAVTEKIAENMTIVQTGIPAPEPQQGISYIGAFG